MEPTDVQQMIRLLTEIRDILVRQDKVVEKEPVQVLVPVKATVTPFESFWTAYPRKIGKGAAELAWKKLKPDQDLVKIMLEAIGKQKSCEQWRKESGQYIPHPATWLNGKRWLDQHTVEVKDKPPVMYREHTPLPAGEPPPPEVAAALSRLLGKSMTFPGQE